MKKLLLALALAGMLWSCGKDGEVGPKGDKGEQGQQGEKGLQGEKGIDGTTLLSGNGSPQLTIGKAGDYYINLSTSNLYGPKTSTTWGQPTSMKGEKGSDGSNGKDGSKILSGTGLPISSDGSIGDFYFSKGYLAFYGPKTSAGWGSGVVLGSTQAFGVQTFLVKDIKFNKVTILDYTPHSLGWHEPFIISTQNITIPGVNLKRGITYIYVGKKDNFKISNPFDVTDYEDNNWQILGDYDDFEGRKMFNHDYTEGNFSFNIIYYGLTKNSVRVQISGMSSSNIYGFNRWKDEVSADIIIKHIPEASVSQIAAKGLNTNNIINLK